MKYLIPLIFVITTSNANWKNDRENLEKVYILNEFRLFYSLNGKDALKDVTDSNKNQIPDIVENVALQLDVSNKLFENTFKYKNPLEQQKYIQKEAKYIDVHFIETHNHGESGDATILYDYKNFKNDSKSLSITISNDLKTGNLTPLHELFHSYQYGYTMFKNRWLIEGTARWSEKILEEGTGSQKKLPKTIEEIHELLNGSYDTSYFWNRLAKVCTLDEKDFIVPKEFKDIKYVGTNQNIIEDNTIYGSYFMKILWQNFDYFDNVVSKERNFDELDWKESDQKDFSNNKYILLAIKKSIEDIKLKRSTDELKDFLKSLDNYLIEYDENQKLLDVTNNIKDLGTPYESIYKNGTEDVFSRNVWDMQKYKDKIYLSGGNASNSSPSANSGPLPLISFNTKTNQFEEEFIIEDEQIDTLKIINDKLFIPGYDTVHKESIGNFYYKDLNSWFKQKNIPEAIHVFDMIYYKNILFAAIGTPNGAAIAKSNDFGKNWELEYFGEDRFYSFLVANDNLFALKKYPSKKDFEQMSKEELDNFFYITIYKNGSFKQINSTNPIFFKDADIKDNQTLIIKRAQEFDKKTLYQVSFNHLKPYGFYTVSYINNSFDVEKININPMYQIWDYIQKDNRIYFLTSIKENKIYKNIVFYIEIYKINEKPKKLFSFYTNTFARSFEEMNGDFYFGLGTNFKNQKEWTQKELHEDTGKILKIEKKFITRD